MPPGSRAERRTRRRSAAAHARRTHAPALAARAAPRSARTRCRYPSQLLHPTAQPLSRRGRSTPFQDVSFLRLQALALVDPEQREQRPLQRFPLRPREQVREQLHRLGGPLILTPNIEETAPGEPRMPTLEDRAQ